MSEDQRYAAIAGRDATATSQFVYAHRDGSVFCRPDCDAQEVPRRSSLLTFDTYKDAMTAGLKPCRECKPDLDVKVDDDIIDSTVLGVNAQLGLSLGDGSGHHQRSLSSVTSPESASQDWGPPRRASIANGHIPVAGAALREIARARRRESSHRGEGDHARLVGEACRHIAAAAAAAAATAAVAASDEEMSSRRRRGRDSVTKLQRKKRRGGILGFKELAAKAGLSPWHFHRVFRSVTGLTPKAYGEACWSAVTSKPDAAATFVTAGARADPSPQPVANAGFASPQPTTAATTFAPSPRTSALTQPPQMAPATAIAPVDHIAPATTMLPVTSASLVTATPPVTASLATPLVHPQPQQLADAATAHLMSPGAQAVPSPLMVGTTSAPERAVLTPTTAATPVGTTLADTTAKEWESFDATVNPVTTQPPRGAPFDNPIEALSPVSTGLGLDNNGDLSTTDGQADYEVSGGFAMNELLTTMAADSAPFEPTDSFWQMMPAADDNTVIAAGGPMEMNSFMNNEFMAASLLEETKSS